MREKFRELGIKTTELSNYMRISRPSLYKYIELYESKEYRQIPDKVLRSFRYIDRYKNITREQVIVYVIGEFSDTDTCDKKETIRNYLLKKGANDPAIDLMYVLITTNSFDGIVQYLSCAGRIIDEGRFDDEGIRQASRLLILKRDIMENTPLKDEELEEIRLMVGELE